MMRAPRGPGAPQQPWQAGTVDAYLREPIMTHATLQPHGHTTRSGHTITILGAFAPLVALLPWLIQIPPLSALLCAIQVTVAAAGAVRSAYPALRPTGLITFIFTFSWLGVAPVYQLAHKTAAWQDRGVLIGPYTVPALALNALATLAMYAGFSYGGMGGKNSASRLPQSRRAAPSRLVATL